MKASDLLVKCLEEEHIEYIFGVPGEENADLMMSLEQSGKITFILTRHEQGAAFMAEAYGRLTGNPAGCLSTLGPGASNLITGVADANMDNAPVIAITGQGASTRLHKESHQIMDVVDMFEPVTKWATTILHPDNIPEIVRKAVRIARTEKPGAVLIELPEDLAKMQTRELPIEPRRFRRPVADDKIVDSAFERMVNARNPVIIAGNGCIRKPASEQLRKLCDMTGIGVISTFMAKGCVDMKAPYCLFTIGLQARDVIACAVDEADLIITIGYDMVEYHPRLWNPDGTKNVIHIDFVPSEIDNKYHPQMEVIGDLPHTLWMLNQRLENYLSNNSLGFDLSHQKTIRQTMLLELSSYKDDLTEGLIKPQKLLWDIRQYLAEDDILLSDVGAHKMWVARHYQCHRPNTCLIPNGFCSMGFALPGAFAASLVHPDKKILAICGDAGFLMNVQEMETIRRFNANIVVMVWVDNAYGLIEWKQHNEFGRHTDLSFNNPDWKQLSLAFDWSHFVINNSTDIISILGQAFQTEGPSLVTVAIDYRENIKLTERLGDISCSI